MVQEATLACRFNSAFDKWVWRNKICCRRCRACRQPGVAYGIMPAFMLANAGVSVDRMDLGTGDAQLVMMGVGMDLLAGKPLGIHPHMLVVRWAGAACRPE